MSPPGTRREAGVVPERMAPWLALVATALSATVYAQAFAPPRLAPLAWVALVPFLVALRRSSTGMALGLAFLWAPAASIFVARALPEAVSGYFLQSPLVSWGMALFVWTFTGSLYYMAFAVVYRLAGRRPGVLLPLIAAAGWVALELGRGRLLTGTSFFVGNPWALIGHSQVEWIELIQVASLAGVYGVGFAVVAVNAGLAEVWLAWRARTQPLPRAGVAALLACVPAAAALAYGASVLRSAHEDEEPIRVAIVQGNLDLGSRWRSEFYGRNLDTYLDLSLQAIDRERPSVVFWPELALTFHLADEPLFRQAIARVLAAGDAQLVAGGPYAEDGAEDDFRNSVFVLSAEGEVQARYDKQYLVPFAEFAPLPRFELGRRDFGAVRAFGRGASAAPLPTRAGPAGIMICNEAMLPEVAAERVRAGAHYLVNPSNDSWIAAHGFAEGMFDMVSFRAVEQRRYLVRASTAGPSAVVDPWGRVRARIEQGTRGLVLAGVRPRQELSPYSRSGDAFALGCVGVAIVAALRGARR